MGELGTSPEVSDDMSPSRSFSSSSGSGSGSTCTEDEALDLSPSFWRLSGGKMGSSGMVESSKSFTGSGESDPNELMSDDRSESASKTILPTVTSNQMVARSCHVDENSQAEGVLGVSSEMRCKFEVRN